MFTRSRQSQNYSGGPQRNQAGAQNQSYQGQGQQNFNNQGNYPSGNQNQYKQQGGGTPYKQQAQQQQPQTPQNQQARNAQQPKQQQNQPQGRQQPQQQQPQSQQVQQQQPQQPQQQQQTPQRLKPILKSSSNAQANQPQTPNQNQSFNQSQQNVEIKVQQQSNNGVENTDNPPESIDGDHSQDVPKWKRKTPGVKVNKKLKRLRLNARLRRTLQPKNAIMVLNEMKTGVHFTFPEQQSAVSNSLFLVHAEINGKTYVGQGVSKPLARQNAAENALKTLLLEKMTAAALKAGMDPESEGLAALQTGSEESESKDGESSMEVTSEDPNEIPWSSLASFALYKLFLDWQNQGTVVPVPRPGISGKIKKEVIKPVGPKELPPNPLIIHPVMLLNQMKPGLIYTEISRVGNPPNITFTLGVEIDGQEFTGTAKNKKDAKKLAAKSALQSLFNLTYPEENTSSEDVNMA